MDMDTKLSPEWDPHQSMSSLRMSNDEPAVSTEETGRMREKKEGGNPANQSIDQARGGVMKRKLSCHQVGGKDRTAGLPDLHSRRAPSAGACPSLLTVTPGSILSWWLPGLTHDDGPWHHCF